jgi:hypothetical protein
VVRAADVGVVQDLARDVSAVLESPEALATLDPASIDLLRAEVDRIKRAADTGDEGRRYNGLRKGVRGLAYATGAIIGAYRSPVIATGTGAAAMTFDRLNRRIMFYVNPGDGADGSSRRSRMIASSVSPSKHARSPRTEISNAARRAEREVWLARYRRTATATVQLAR